MNGMREVLLKTDEVQKQKIPHLVKLGSGQSILVTMQGRPPLCLKCHDVGHTCKDCPSGPSNRRSFPGVAAHGRLPGPQAAEPPVGGNSEPVGSENAPPPQNLGAGGSDTGVIVSDDQEPMESTSNSKRGRDADDDFIAPNKPAKMGPPPASSPSSLIRQV